MTIAVGQVIPARIIGSVDPARMKTLSALMRDPNPIHFEAAAVEALGMGGRTINQGPSNIAYVLTMLADWVGGSDRITRYQFRFLGNVFAGDSVRAGGTVAAVEHRSEGRLVHCALTLDVVGGGRVLQGSASVLIPQT